jgi:hypothetical protein
MDGQDVQDEERGKAMDTKSAVVAEFRSDQTDRAHS